MTCVSVFIVSLLVLLSTGGQSVSALMRSFRNLSELNIAAVTMRHPGKKAKLSDRKCPCWTFPAPPHLPHHTHTHRDTSLLFFFVN